MSGVLHDPIVKSKMLEINCNKNDVKNIMNMLKNNKQPGPDKMKSELYRAVGKSNECIRILTSAFNILSKENRVPESWKESKTVMLPKIKKPTAKDHRPIALTNVIYKLYMSLVRDKIIEHLINNELINEYQVGFTKGKRIEENIFIFCIDKSYQNKKPLIVVSIDFRKAFDSIDRKGLIKAMKYYQVHDKVIDNIMELYTNDKTEIWRNNKMVGEAVITNGIRQGCTGSPQLFNLIINMIIIKITESRMGYRNKEFYIPVLFYADDVLLISNSTEEASKMIDLLVNRGKQCGLEINKEKSNCILFNSTENRNEINDIKHIDKIKYLGVVINNKRQCLNKYKNDKIKLAKHMENTTYSVIHRSSNKLLIGKIFGNL